MAAVQNPVGAHPFVSADAALRFICAGNARMTLRSRKTGTRYTYQVRRAEDSSPHDPVFFVSLLKGPDNGADYSYLGVLRQGRFGVTRTTKHLAGATYAQAFGHAMRCLVDGRRIHPNLEIWHESRCGRCGRTLTVPESVESGFGPECVKRVGVGG